MDINILVALPAGKVGGEELAPLQSLGRVTLARSSGEYLANYLNTDVLLVWDLQTRFLKDFGPGNMKWIHTTSIGVDAVATQSVVEARIPVTNTRGLFERPMAEFALGGVFFHTKNIANNMEDKTEKRWHQTPLTQIRGRKAAVIGAGGVGREVARLFKSVGIDTDLFGRSKREDEEFGTVFSTSELSKKLPFYDDVVLAVPLTTDTEHLIGESELALMKRSSHLINIGRGQLVDEEALIQALNDGALAAATLDVFEKEPLPHDSPLWGMQNVYVSPHSSANFLGWREEAMKLFIKNFSAWRSGEQMTNLVDINNFVAS